MLKLILSSFLFILLSSQGLLAQTNDKDAKIVTPNDIQKKELLQTKKANTTIQNEGQIKNSNEDELDDSSEYPKRISVGTKHKVNTESTEPELTKEEKIEKLEKKITSAEWKIAFLKEESEAGNADEIKQKEAALKTMKQQLEDLKK
tara:strand:- start:298 stop:738 length:441 start_codon:yes stop_codon:yes gene_type:complete